MLSLIIVALVPVSLHSNRTMTVYMEEEVYGGDTCMCVQVPEESTRAGVTGD